MAIGRPPKQIDRDTFLACLEAYIYSPWGERDANKFGKICGVSGGTFITRANQFLFPDQYGEIPEGILVDKPVTAKDLPVLD